ncbi:MAG: hypothetical protein L0Y56_05505 [Nitrospira sp.]|nr:hypothetical protein [Nitrospira sp.]
MKNEKEDKEFGSNPRDWVYINGKWQLKDEGYDMATHIPPAFLDQVAPCHNGTVNVFRDPSSGVWIRGGGKSRDFTSELDDLVIDLAQSSFYSETLVQSTYKSKHLSRYTEPLRISVDWKDFQDISLDKSFWIDLIKEIRHLKRDVSICCIGGHGRTGTALSILVGLMLPRGFSDGDPVQFVREAYCANSVESNVQIDYIEHITGMKVKAGPAKESHYGAYQRSA